MSKCGLINKLISWFILGFYFLHSSNTQPLDYNERNKLPIHLKNKDKKISDEYVILKSNSPKAILVIPIYPCPMGSKRDKNGICRPIEMLETSSVRPMTTTSHYITNARPTSYATSRPTSDNYSSHIYSIITTSANSENSFIPVETENEINSPTSTKLYLNTFRKKDDPIIKDNYSNKIINKDVFR